MYVCLCKGVTDEDIRQAVNGGAESVRAVRDKTGAMTQCGKCACLARDIISETLESSPEKDKRVFYNVA